MVTAEEDEDSENDCLYIDEDPTANTSQPQDAATTSTNELPNSELPIDFISLMRNVEIIKNIPCIPDVSKKQVEPKQKARIACRDFSRKPFGTNEMLSSALYHHLTTDNTMPPNQKHKVTPNDLRAGGKKNLKHVLDAPSNPYAPLPTRIAADRRVHPQTETFMTPQTQNDHIIQPNMNGYVQYDHSTQPNMNGCVQNDSRTQPNTNVYVQSDLRNQPNMIVYTQNCQQTDGNQMPIAEPSPKLPNNTSMIVPHRRNSAGAVTYRQTTDQRPANNMPRIVNGYQAHNGSAPANLESQIRQMYNGAHTEYYGQTTMTYQGVGPHGTCSLTCPCRRFGVKSYPPLNADGDAPMNMHSLNPEPMTTFDHHAPNREALNPGHELMIPSSSPQNLSMNSTFNVPGQGGPASNPDHEFWPSSSQHQPINSTFNPQVTCRGELALSPEHELMIPSSSPQNLSMNSTFNVPGQGGPASNPDHEFWPSSSQHQPINSTFNPQVTSRGELALSPEHELMIPSLSPQHKSRNPLNSQPHSMHLSSINQHRINLSMSSHHQSMASQNLMHVQTTTDMGGSPINMSPITLQTINPSLNPQPHSSMPSPPCYYCAMSKPSLRNPVPSYVNGQPAVPISNSHTGTWNGYGYNREQIRKAGYLTALRAQEYLQRDKLAPPVPVKKKPRAPAKQRTKPVQKIKNVNANLAVSPICTERMNNSTPAPAWPCCTPTQSYPLSNWMAFGIPTPKTVKVSNAKETQDNNIEISHIATDLTQKTNTNMTQKIIEPVSIENHKQIVNGRTETTRTNVTSTAYNMNAVNLMQDSSIVEGKVKPLNMNLNNNGNHLMEASTQQDTSSNDVNQWQIHIDQPCIDIESDGVTERMNNGTFTSTWLCCTPTQSYPLSNWVASEIPTPKTVKVSNAKETQDNNIKISHIATDLTQKSNTNITPKIIEPFSVENHKQMVNERAETIQTNVTSTSYNMNAVNLMQDSSIVEGKVKPLNMNLNNNGTHLMEASTQQDTSSNDVNQWQIYIDQPWIDIKSDEASIQASVIQTTTKTATKNVQNESFLQQASDNIDIETAIALLHADTPEAPTNIIQNSKVLAISTNAYELVCTTSATKDTSHIINSNNIIIRTETSNYENVSIVNKIITNPNISLPRTETVLDILHKVQMNSGDEANIEEDMEQISTEDKNKIKKIDTAVDDGFTKQVEEDDHKPTFILDGKDDDSLNKTPKNLARWFATEHDNENKYADYNAKTDTNEYHIEVRTGPRGEYIAQVKISSSDGSSVQQEEFNIKNSIGKTTNITSADSSEYNILPKLETKIGNYRDINESQKKENIKNEDSASAIDEMIFFKFQINFFRLVQERLRENNQEVYAQKLHNAIYDLIILSDYEDATADLKYECHECHNVTIYSPRHIYYNGNSYLKRFINSANKCQLCLIFRRKYIEVLVKYIKLETSGANLNTSSKQFADNTEINDQTPNTTTDLINERQTHTKPVQNFNDASDRTNKKNKECNNKEQSRVITADALSSSKQVKIKDQKKHTHKNSPDSLNQTDFVVKLPLHKLKESTVKALIQRQNLNCNDSKSDKVKNLNIVLHDKQNNGNKNSSYLEEEPAIETVTTTAALHGNISTSLANDNKKENHYSKSKTIKSETVCSSRHKNYQERCPNKRKISNAENESNLNPDPRNINLNIISNNNDAQLENHYKKEKRISEEINPIPQKINATIVSKNLDESDKNQKRDSKKRKSLSGEIVSTTTLGKNITFNNIDDQNKNQDQHSKRRKSICTKHTKITSPNAQTTTTRLNNNDDNDKNHERSSKKRKSTSDEVAPSKNHNRNTNASENNDKDREGHSKRRKSISAESESRANQNNCRNKCYNTERDLKVRKNSIFGSNKYTATKNKEEHKIMQPNPSKNIRDETATSKNDKTQKRKTITSNNERSNSNKEPCNSEINQSANNKQDIEEVRKIIAVDTTAESTNAERNNNAGRNIQDNSSNNEGIIARTCEARKNTSADILSTKQTTTESKAKSTATTTNIHTENQNLPIIKIRKNNEDRFIIHNDGEEGNNGVNTVAENASGKSAEKLNAKEKDELPRVKLPDKKENRGKNEKDVLKAIAKIKEKYVCNYCYMRYSSFLIFEKHLSDHHKIVKIESKDYIKMTTCPFCPEDMIEKVFNKHVKDRHPDKRLQTINK